MKAERVGFEPTVAHKTTTVFETAPFVHSGTSPNWTNYNEVLAGFHKLLELLSKDFPAVNRVLDIKFILIRQHVFQAAVRDSKLAAFTHIEEFKGNKLLSRKIIVAPCE